MTKLEELEAKVREHKDAIRNSKSGLLKADREKAIRRLEKQILREKSKEAGDESASFPNCSMGSLQCFAKEGGKCTILTDTYFRDRACPFYKSREQHLADQAEIAKKLRIRNLL